MSNFKQTKLKDFFIRQHQVKTPQVTYTIVSFVCGPLERAGFANAFGTRLGGVSPLPKNALNLSDKKDSKKNVRENTRRFLESLAEFERPIILANQIHSDKFLWVGKKDQKGKCRPRVDALGSQASKAFLGVKTADCLPLLLGDPTTGVFAVVHAGWRGTLSRIVEKTIQHLVLKKNIHPENLIVAMGPAACGRCFEVGEGVAQKFKTEFKKTGSFLSRKPHSSHYALDTTAANCQQLLGQGIKKENIFYLPFCTMHNNSLFFSHRQESNGGKKEVGRQLSVIGRMK